MDHLASITATVRLALRTAATIPAALAATEDTPLRSPTTDGGTRPIGSHSDPTPTSAIRRRRTDERRRIDQLTRELHDTATQLHALTTKVTAPPTKTGTCRTCTRTGQILTPPHNICIHCIQAVDKARRRWTNETPFDPAVWVERRHNTLHTKATAGN